MFLDTIDLDQASDRDRAQLRRRNDTPIRRLVALDSAYRLKHYLEQVGERS